MLRTAGLFFIACCALSALSLADARKSKPSATVSPASDFDVSSVPPTITPLPNVTTPMPNITTMAPNITTPMPNITTLAPNITTPMPNITTLAPNITTPMPNVTTLAPNITTPMPNVTTLAPNITTPMPNVTTMAPNTTTMSPNVTTMAPNTTTTATTTMAPTTTASPSPPPVGDYNVTVGATTCLRAHVTLQIRLGNSSFTVQPNEARADGSCGEASVTFNLTFSQGFINFNFTRNITNDTVFMDAVAFSLSYPLGRGLSAGEAYTARNTSVYLFPAKVGHSYSCRSDSLYMGNGLYLDVSNDKMQAFNLTKNDVGTPDPCPADQPDYRVAIGVGVTLLVLIVVVVVAYLLSRRKRMAGYQSL